MDFYVKDNKITKVVPTKNHPVNKGLACIKGINLDKQQTNGQVTKKPLLRDENGEIVTTILNEQLGLDIAKAGNGIYVNANNSDALSELLKQLGKIKKTKLQASIYTIHDELFPIFAWILLVLLVADIFILERKISWLSKITFFKKEDKK